MDGAEEGMEGDLLDLWKAVKGHTDKGMIATLAEVRAYLGIQHHAPKVKNQKKYEKPKQIKKRKTLVATDYLLGRGIDNCSGYDYCSTSD